MTADPRPGDGENALDTADIGRLIHLLNRFSVQMTDVVDRSMGTDYAGNKEMLAIVALCRSDQLTFKEIASSSGLSRRAVSKLVRLLEKGGLVTKGRAPKDRRVAVIRLTHAGRGRRDEMEAGLDDFFETARPAAKEIADILIPLEDSVPGSLRTADPIELLKRVAEAGVEVNAAVRRRTKSEAIWGRHQLALLLIATEGTTYPCQLASEIGVTSGGLTYVVDQLERRGLAMRRYGGEQGDRRRVEIVTTRRGQHLADETLAGLMDVAEALGHLFIEVRDRVTPA